VALCHHFRYSGQEGGAGRSNREAVHQDKPFARQRSRYLLPEGEWSTGVHGTAWVRRLVLQTANFHITLA